jgi:hypothetical protein
VDDSSKKTKQLPFQITQRIRQLQRSLQEETVKVQALIAGLCEGYILAEGVTGGKWQLSEDATKIELEGAASND